MKLTAMNLTVKIFALSVLLGLCLFPAHAAPPFIKSGGTDSIPTMVNDVNGNAVSGLGTAFTATVRKPGTSAYVAAAGTVVEVGNGIYDYVPATSETAIAATKNTLLVHLVSTATATTFGDSSAQIVGFDPTSDLGAAALAGISTTTSSTNALASAIKPQTDLIATNGMDSPNEKAAQGKAGIVTTNNDKTGYTVSTVQDKTGYTAAASNLPSDYQQRGTAVTLPATAPAGYGGVFTLTAQNITDLTNAVMQANIDGTLTHKQVLALLLAYSFNPYTRTKTATSQSLVYQNRAGLPLATSTSGLDALGNITGRTSVTFTNLP